MHFFCSFLDENENPIRNMAILQQGKFHQIIIYALLYKNEIN